MSSVAAALKCAKKASCTNPGIVCASRGCQKVICEACYLGVLQRKNTAASSLVPLPKDQNGNVQVACTKKCHLEAQKIVTADHLRLAWDDDTPNGEYEGSSEALLIDWLKTPGKYADWRGNNHGITKQTFNQEIADMINSDGLQKGIVCNRSVSSVGNKIAQIEQKFCETLAWKEDTGQGSREDENLSDEKFKDLATKRWQHFWDLYDIIGDQSCMKPVFNSDDFDNSENESSDSILDSSGNEEGEDVAVTSDKDDDASKNDGKSGNSVGGNAIGVMGKTDHMKSLPSNKLSLTVTRRMKPPALERRDQGFLLPLKQLIIVTARRKEREDKMALLILLLCQVLVKL